MKTNILGMVQRCRSIPRLAILVRAFGCQVTAGLAHLYSPAKTVEQLVRYEQDAQAVERCERIADARRYLRDRGYFGVVPNIDLRGRGAAHAAHAHGAPLYVLNPARGWVRGGEGALARLHRLIADPNTAHAAHDYGVESRSVPNEQHCGGCWAPQR